MKFDWDEAKRQRNVAKHGIDFFDAKEIWSEPVLELPSPQTDHGETRWLAIGSLGDRTITVIYTWRGEIRRIISARIARHEERETYQRALGR